MNYTIETESGTVIETVTSVQIEDTTSGDSSIASIKLLSDDETRTLASSNSIIIYRDGTPIYKGNVYGKTKKGSGNANTLKAYGDLKLLTDYDAGGRVFFEQNSSDVVEKLLKEEVQDEEEEILYNGAGTELATDLTNNNGMYTGPANLLGYTTPFETGGQAYFIGFIRESDNGGIVQFPGLQYNGDELHELVVPILAHNSGGIFSFDIEFKDEEDIYRWEDIRVTEYEKVSLKPDEAVDTDKTPDSKFILDDSSGSYLLAIRVHLDGTLPDDGRAIAIDSIQAKPYSVSVRDPPIFETLDIGETNRTITRRFSESVSDAIRSIQEEETYNLYVDFDSQNNSVGRYRPIGADRSDVDAIYNDTDIVDIVLNTDYSDIYNRVVVDGKDDIRYAAIETTSQQIYQVVNTKKINDPSITRLKTAAEKGKKFLQDNAFTDTILTVKLRENLFGNVKAGDTIKIEWPPLNINSRFIVKSVTETNRGFNKLQVKASVDSLVIQ